ncbi:hypothetical protein B0H19DRAFT_1061390 [Mycena capillaripes]|nr:hypothetical protein B0H19DRAFT_1061390 [Mycena capillaripes]
MVFSSDVLVVGAGPSGLILALCLAMLGVSVRIIDKKPSYRIGKRGAGITPRTLEVFKMLGVLDEVFKLAHKPVQFQSYELPDGIKSLKTWSMSPTLEPTPACPFLNTVFLGQDQVEGILRERLKMYGCFVELGTQLLDFDQHEDGIAATLSITGRKEEVNVKYLVGADGTKGLNSQNDFIELLIMHLEYRNCPETRTEDQLVVSDVIVDGLDSEHIYIWTRGSAVTILAWPGQTQMNLFSIQMLGEELDCQKVISDPGEFRRFFRMQTDAAHVHSLVGGQGMNSSVQDSFNVGWKLASVVLGLSSPDLLCTYSEERLPVIAEMLNKTTELHTKAFKSNNLADQSHWKRGKSLGQLGINYRWSSIVIEETPRSSDETLGAYGHDGEGTTLIAAGDRAPDAPGLVDVKEAISQRSLFEIFKYTAHSILIFCRPAAAEQSTVHEILQFTSHLPQRVRAVVVYPDAMDSGADAGFEGTEADIVVWDRDWHAFREYRAPADNVHCVVVRPDGMVEAIVSGVLGLKRYFDIIFAARI